MLDKKELPNGWAEATINDLISEDGLFVDGDWIESKDQDTNGDVRLIQLADIGDGIFRDKSNRFLTQKRARELNCTFLKVGDVLVARMPDPIGRACIFPLKGKNKFITVVDVAVVRLGKNNISSGFLVHSINNQIIRNKIESLQSGTTRKRISRANLATINFPIPPISEQQRITLKIEELFSSLDNGIESIKAAQNQFIVYRQAVLKQAFEGVFTAKWRSVNQYSLVNFLEKLKKQKVDAIKLKLIKNDKYFEEPLPKNIIYKVPSNWLQLSWKTITSNNKYAMKRGPFGSSLKKEFFVSKGYTVYEQGHAINDDPYRTRYYISEKKYKEMIAFAVKPGDMIISCSGVTLGRISLLPKDSKKGIINQALLKIDLDENIVLKKFFILMFRSETFQRKIFQKSLGTAMPNMVGMDELRELIIPIPSIAEQEQIIQEIESRLLVCDKIEESITQSLMQAEALRQSILKMAFEGKLVPQDPNDEPASKLLERIKKSRESIKHKKKK